MTTARQWVDGARPRTLPAAVAPVAVGTGVAVGSGAGSAPRALLALVVALALQVAVNYANDYSDGVRGTDDDRIGPMRLVGSGAASPAAVKAAALAAFCVAAVAGLVLAALTTWWLLGVGLVAFAAAWLYTGGSRPYGYRGLGEVSVFLFFGVVAVVGTAYVQIEAVPLVAVVASVPVGALACALLVVNNLRDIPSDEPAGKRTLAVVLGETRTRLLFVGLMVTPIVAALALAPARPGSLAALLAARLAVGPARAVRAGARGSGLLPVLRDTGRYQLVYGLLLGAGLALG